MALRALPLRLVGARLLLLLLLLASLGRARAAEAIGSIEPVLLLLLLDAAAALLSAHTTGTADVLAAYAGALAILVRRFRRAVVRTPASELSTARRAYALAAQPAETLHAALATVQRLAVVGGR